MKTLKQGQVLAFIITVFFGLGACSDEPQFKGGYRYTIGDAKERSNDSLPQLLDSLNMDSVGISSPGTIGPKARIKIN